MTALECGPRDGVEPARDLIARGPILRVSVGYDPSFAPRSPRSPPSHFVAGLPALLDTGASISGVNLTLAKHLDLKPVDELEIATAHGLHLVELVRVQIHVPELQFTFYGPLAALDLGGGEGDEVVLGRDFLRHFTFVYDGPRGSVTLVDPDAQLPITDFPDG